MTRRLAIAEDSLPAIARAVSPGMAIAAMMPITATTISSSISVNPDSGVLHSAVMLLQDRSRHESYKPQKTCCRLNGDNSWRWVTNASGFSSRALR